MRNENAINRMRNTSRGNNELAWALPSIAEVPDSQERAGGANCAKYHCTYMGQGPGME